MIQKNIGYVRTFSLGLVGSRVKWQSKHGHISRQTPQHSDHLYDVYPLTHGVQY